MRLVQGGRDEAHLAEVELQFGARSTVGVRAPLRSTSSVDVDRELAQLGDSYRPLGQART